MDHNDYAPVTLTLNRESWDVITLALLLTECEEARSDRKALARRMRDMRHVIQDALEVEESR